MAALVFGAIDQETANAVGAHLSECDLLLAADGGYADIEARFLGSDPGREPVKSEALANGGGVRALVCGSATLRPLPNSGPVQLITLVGSLAPSTILQFSRVSPS
jgi:hypothetical protein